MFPLCRDRREQFWVLIADAYDEVVMNIEKKSIWREKIFDYIPEEVMQMFKAWKVDKCKSVDVTATFKAQHGKALGNNASALKKACWGSKIHDAYSEAQKEINSRYNMWFRSWNTKPPLRK